MKKQGGRLWPAVQCGGQTLHHIIDPQTGRPAESQIVRSTVIAPDATLAVV